MTTVTITSVRGLKVNEYEAIKAAAKKELPFGFTIRMHKTVGSYGSIDIRPTKKSVVGEYKWMWTNEQVEMVYAFIQRYDLVTGMMSHIDRENIAYVYSRGFNYLRTTK